MCGIAGILAPHGLPQNHQMIANKMMQALKRRGPDDHGTWVNQGQTVNLISTRLSILDISKAGHQPMCSKDGRYCVVYNGEIYNFMEIRAELESLGHIFISNGDTEVLLNSFVEWGPASVEHFIGMYAFAIWDCKEHKLWLFRDRIGVKPLYYYHSDGLFLFASELKAIHCCSGAKLDVDMQSLASYLQYGYIASPGCIYRDMCKLSPGHYAVVNKENVCDVKQYWSPLSYRGESPIIGQEEDIVTELEAILRDAFRYRMVSDVPVGVFLSGGVDSSLVAALLQSEQSQRLKTFTIGFKGYVHDESVWARKVADHLGTEHYEAQYSIDALLESIRILPDVYDEPFADNSSLPTMLLSRVAKEKVTVALSGDGGDELFGGYNHYGYIENAMNHWTGLREWPISWLNHCSKILGYDKLVWLSRVLGKGRTSDVARVIRILLERRDLSELYDAHMAFWHPEEIIKVMKLPYKSGTLLDKNSGSSVEQMMLWDLLRFLPDDGLTKVDRASMYVGLEVREPLLDHRIIQYAMRMPLCFKIRDGQNKYILRKILSKYIAVQNNLKTPHWHL